jgi:hypothetical protein
MLFSAECVSLQLAGSQGLDRGNSELVMIPRAPLRVIA